MSTAARIEELRKKFDENPRRYFAPLANELRKAGDLTQAIALCREHLPKQPGHMSGYIVFGQALFESGELDDARLVFEQALALDPENLIALHHLGHIARQQGDTATARRWYERALETDPRNDDIAYQLSALATPARPQAAIPTSNTSASAVPAPAGSVPAAPLPAGEWDRDVASLDAEAPATGPDLGDIPTTALLTDAVGDSAGELPLAPPLDAVLRAVDFDAVNASLQGPPSSASDDIGAIDAMGNPLRAESGGRADAEPLDLTLDELVPGDSAVSGAPAPVALPYDATDDAILAGPDETITATPVVADDPFGFGAAVDTEATVRDEVVDLEAAFEEGLVTAGWPEANALAARSATPRSAPPLAVDVPLEAAEAFGLEPADPVRASLPEPEPDVLIEEAEFAIPAPVADGQDTLPWLAASDPGDEDDPALGEEVSAIAEAMEADARATGGADDVSLSALAEPVGPEDVPWEVNEASFVDVLPDTGELEVLETGVADAFDDVATAFGADEPVDAEVEAEGSESQEAPAFVTETMGELLVAQGFVDRAVVVYEELVRRRPYDPVLSARLVELREQLVVAAPVSIFTARERFARLAARRVTRRTPARTMTPVTHPIAVAPPAVLAPVTATPAMPMPHDSLAALFGSAPASEDDFAARALAEAFTPVPLDTPSLGAFELAFFGESDAPRVPTPVYGAMRQPTPAAPSETLASPAASPTPRSARAVPTTPGATPPAQSAAGDFSFDRFFPDPANTPTSVPTPAAGASSVPQTGSGESSGAGSASEDLAQFSAWLKGLGNP